MVLSRAYIGPKTNKGAQVIARQIIQAPGVLEGCLKNASLCLVDPFAPWSMAERCCAEMHAGPLVLREVASPSPPLAELRLLVHADATLAAAPARLCKSSACFTTVLGCRCCTVGGTRVRVPTRHMQTTPPAPCYHLITLGISSKNTNEGQ